MSVPPWPSFPVLTKTTRKPILAYLFEPRLKMYYFCLWKKRKELVEKYYIKGKKRFAGARWKTRLDSGLDWTGLDSFFKRVIFFSGRGDCIMFLVVSATFTDRKKMTYNYSDPGGTLEKLSKLKPLISRSEELYISKEVKEKMLVHQRAIHANQKQRSQKINIRVTTPQFEIRGKNNIWSVKAFSSRP